MRQLLATLLEADPQIQVVGTAADPHIARERIKALNPDVITLDVEMPHMDGLTFLRKIMALRPTPVVMISTLTQRGADITLEALEVGAVDFIAKPTDGLAEAMAELADRIQAKVKAAAGSRVGARRATAPSGPRPQRPARARRQDHFCRRFDRRRGSAQGAVAWSAGRLPAGPDHPAYAATIYHRICPAARPRMPDASVRGDPRRSDRGRPRLYRAGLTSSRNCAGKAPAMSAACRTARRSAAIGPRSMSCSARPLAYAERKRSAPFSPAWGKMARRACWSCAAPEP